MLKVGTYKRDEIFAALNSHSRQSVNRKLERYGVIFKVCGRGQNLTYKIQKITNAFKLYCITELGISANVDFEKFKYFCLYLFCDDTFITLPIVKMEQILRTNGTPISRQTISKSIRYLQNNNYIAVFKNDCRYYAIDSLPNGEKSYTEIEHEKYKKGWQIYWDSKRIMETGLAYWKMRKYIGGHPYKCPKIEQNAFYSKEIKTLIDLIADIFLNQPINKNNN